MNNNYSFADNPDHPYLLMNPDFLIGKRGNLFAFYEPSQDEISKPDNLLARFALSKIAFPEYTKHLLILNKIFDKDIGFTNNFYNNFDKIFDKTEIKDLVKYLEKRHFQKNIDHNIKYKKIIAKRFSIIFTKNITEQKQMRYKTNSLVLQPSRHFFKPNINSWANRNKKLKVTKNLFVFCESLITHKKIRNSYYNFTKNVRNMIVASTLKDYNIDKGEFVGIQSTINFLKINHIPALYYDPLKAFRVLSFSGWNLTNNLSPNFLERIIHLYHKSYENYR